MAKVIENVSGGRRKILLSTYDIINIVRNYQYLVQNVRDYEAVLDLLNQHELFLPEDF